MSAMDPTRLTRASRNNTKSNPTSTIEIKQEPEEDLNEVQLVLRSATSENDISSQYYQYESIRDQVESIWNGVDSKPKIERSEILESNRRLVIKLDRDWLRNHFRTKWISLVKLTFHHRRFRRACQLCSHLLCFKSAAELIKHYKQFHSRQITSYKCTLCEFSGKSESEIVRHWKVEHIHEKNRNKFTLRTVANDPKNIWIGDDELVKSIYLIDSKIKGKELVECKICSKKVARHGLFQHKRLHVTEPLFVCDICQRNFKRKSTLRDHIFTHMKRKPFECEICTKSFAQKRQFESHKFVHNQDLPVEKDPRHKWRLSRKELVECDVCMKKVQRYFLKDHKRVHTDERPFKCDKCDKSFRIKEYLEVHKNVHIKKKRLECSFCGKKFGQRIVLRRHESEHRRKYVCHICKKDFKSRTGMFCHIRIEHFALLRQQDKNTGDLNELFQGRKTFECYRCRFSGLFHVVKGHMEKCRIGARFVNCPKCIRKFSSSESKRAHMGHTHATDSKHSK